MRKIKIEWDGYKNIADLIEQLDELKNMGYESVNLDTYSAGKGVCEDGSNEYDYEQAVLIIK